MIITLITIAVSAALFVHGKIRADLVAAGALLALMLSGVLTPQEALSGFSSPIVIMLASVFVVGGAVARTGLAKRISHSILAFAGTSQTRLFVLIMLVTSAIGAFVSNTGTVAVMLPIVVSMTAALGVSASRFLMPLAFASTMGGMLTLIGTTPNMIISGALEAAGYGPLSFFSFLPIGIICVTVGTTTLLFLSKRLVKPEAAAEKKKKAPSGLRELLNKYQVRQSEHLARILPGSPLVGTVLHGSALYEKYGASLVEIRRKRLGVRRTDSSVKHMLPGPTTIFQAEDVFSFVIPDGTISAFVVDNGLALVSDKDSSSSPEHAYFFDDIGLAELVVLSGARLENKSIMRSGLREQYGLRVLGVLRQGRPMLHKLRDLVIEAGDTLLVQGEWKDIARLDDEPNEWVLVGHPLESASSEPLERKAPVAALIVALMIAAMALNLVPPVAAVMLAALCLILTGCFRNTEEAYKTINWQSVVLVAGMLPVSIALEKTGAATLASQGIIHAVGGMGPYALLAVVYAVASVTTLFISNTAAGALCTPIAMQAAVATGLSPYPFLFAVATAASMSLAFPFSTPPNVLVMSPGGYSFTDYVKVGGPLQILFGILMVIALPLLFPFAQ